MAVAINRPDLTPPETRLPVDFMALDPDQCLCISFKERFLQISRRLFGIIPTVTWHFQEFIFIQVSFWSQFSGVFYMEKACGRTGREREALCESIQAFLDHSSEGVPQVWWHGQGRQQHTIPTLCVRLSWEATTTYWSSFTWGWVWGGNQPRCPPWTVLGLETASATFSSCVWSGADAIEGLPGRVDPASFLAVPSACSPE